MQLLIKRLENKHNRVHLIEYTRLPTRATLQNTSINEDIHTSKHQLTPVEWNRYLEWIHHPNTF